MKSDRVRSWLFRGIGLVLFAVILSRTDLRQTAAAIRGARPLWFAGAVLLIFPMIAFKTARWIDLQRAVGFSGATFGRSYLAYFTGLYAGLVTPGRVGEFVRVKFLTDQGAPFGLSMATVLWDRILDVLGLFLLGVLALWPLAGEFRGLYAGSLVTLALGLLGVVLLVRMGPGRAGGLRARLGERLRRWGPAGRVVSTGGGGLLQASRRLRPGLLIRAGALTIAGWLVYYLQAVLVARSLSIPLGILPLVVCVTAAAVAAFLPLSISGLGTRDAVLVLLFGRLGRPAAEAVALSTLILALLVANALFGLAASQILAGSPQVKIDSREAG